MSFEVLKIETIQKWMPKLLVQGHKSSLGKLQIVAGSENYPGAAVLTSLGALRSACGYVRIKSWAPQALLLNVLPELIWDWKPEDSQALVVGPGLSEAQEVKDFVQSIESLKIPKIFDATALQWATSIFKGILTPHEGEALRMLNVNTFENREALISALAEKYPKATIVLKGPNTLIQSPRGKWICKEGSAAMANAGQGDVLAGVIGAALARGLKFDEAACFGVFVCAQASDLLPKVTLAHEVANYLGLLNSDKRL